MRYTITHRTLYQYSSGVVLCHNEARLLPRETPWQLCRPSQIRIRPRPALSLERQDFFGNRVLYFAIQDVHYRLEVTVATEVRVLNERPFDETSSSPPWEQARQALWESLDPEIIEARTLALDSPFVKTRPAFLAYAEPSFPPGRPLLEAVADLNQRIYREFKYDPHFTTVATPLDEVLSERRGVCQDFAHLAIACLRALGLAARYVSGYLETLPPPGQARLVGADASHAWLAVYVPGIGWAEFDPTNNCMPREKHVTLAWGRDYGDVAPLRGVMTGGGSHALKVAVDVEPNPEPFKS
ncbi:MAG TPA: transglutaminase family protein [Candidatus Competibacteraceae bacterium]|nr:MAG: transglutaminase family protein [Candidatus Competibacteraceae bacterium]HOB61487.1 transglutaminase family protein [Candidatus Competibacteraceae bacterium]HQA26665.1 transglutaminase family protein [Candidatus Competibacteraceae bacterium]HQD56753.1 transglutaminase family protein [Candidatus Competibacteraceae bacterium]